MQDIILAPAEFVALVNQTLEFAYPRVTVEGEIANFRVSKNRWVYFDIKDEQASVKCFGTVYQLPGPIEEGMLMKVAGTPRLHQQYGFSFNVQSMMPSGEGSIKKAAALLEAKLAKEGLFDESRKRSIPYPPEKIGLITSGESAAYADFIKILNQRWQGIELLHKDVQVQGEAAPAQITQAIELFNTHPDYDADVLVVTRGGGSADDLAAFSTEQVTRAAAASRIPTVVAIGHEIDVSLAELAADMRASTPSNAAELLVPDKRQEQAQLKQSKAELVRTLNSVFKTTRSELLQLRRQLADTLDSTASSHRSLLEQQKKLLQAYSPEQVLRRGFAVVRHEGKIIRNPKSIAVGDAVSIQLSKGTFAARREKEES